MKLLILPLFALCLMAQDPIFPKAGLNGAGTGDVQSADDPSVTPSRVDDWGEEPPNWFEIAKAYYEDPDFAEIIIRGWRVQKEKLFEMGGDYFGASYAIKEIAPAKSRYLSEYHKEIRVFGPDPYSFELVACRAEGQCDKPTWLKKDTWEEKIGEPTYTMIEGNHYTEQKIRVHGRWRPPEKEGEDGLCIISDHGLSYFGSSPDRDHCYRDATTMQLSGQ